MPFAFSPSFPFIHFIHFSFPFSPLFSLVTTAVMCGVCAVLSCTVLLCGLFIYSLSHILFTRFDSCHNITEQRRLCCRVTLSACLLCRLSLHHLTPDLPVVVLCSWANVDSTATPYPPFLSISSLVTRYIARFLFLRYHFSS